MFPAIHPVSKLHSSCIRIITNCFIVALFFHIPYSNAAQAGGHATE
jgi:hypothetical protein